VIAIAIALGPDLLIADEPTTALDVSTQRAILQLLSDFNKEFSMAIVLVTHDMGVHAQLANRFCIMYAGKICEIGDVGRVFKEPLHPYSYALISSIPIIGQDKELLGLAGNPPQLVDPPSGCTFHPRCKYATEICSAQTPELREVESGRLVACHLVESIADEIRS